MATVDEYTMTEQEKEKFGYTDYETEICKQCRGITFHRCNYKYCFKFDAKVCLTCVYQSIGPDYFFCVELNKDVMYFGHCHKHIPIRITP